MYNFWLLQNSVAELHSSMCSIKEKKKKPTLKQTNKKSKPKRNKEKPFKFPVWSFPWVSCRYCTVKKWIISPPHFLHTIPDSIDLCYIHHNHFFSFSRGCFMPLIIFVTFSLPLPVVLYPSRDSVIRIEHIIQSTWMRYSDTKLIWSHHWICIVRVIFPHVHYFVLVEIKFSQPFYYLVRHHCKIILWLSAVSIRFDYPE